MGALRHEPMRVERVELTPEQLEERRREAEKLGIKIRRRDTSAKPGK